MKTQNYLKSGLACFVITFLLYSFISFAGRFIYFRIYHVNWTQSLKFALLFAAVLTIMDYLKDSKRI